MRVLLVGGSGLVGGMAIPLLKQEHEVRVLDPRPPADPAVEHVRGSVLDAEAVRRAVADIDALVYMVMGRMPDGSYAARDIDLNYDLHVKGLHSTLDAARQAGVARAVYVSTLSVHGPRPDGVYATEDTPCDATFVYGLAKWLGELVCDYFARVHAMTIVALRLNAPVPPDEWQRRYPWGGIMTWTAGPDVARAIALALTAPLTGFHAVFISGDFEGRRINCARAKALLGWEPLERPLRPQASGAKP